MDQKTTYDKKQIIYLINIIIVLTDIKNIDNCRCFHSGTLNQNSEFKYVYLTPVINIYQNFEITCTHMNKSVCTVHKIFVYLTLNLISKNVNLNYVIIIAYQLLTVIFKHSLRKNETSENLISFNCNKS